MEISLSALLRDYRHMLVWYDKDTWWGIWLGSLFVDYSLKYDVQYYCFLSIYFEQLD